MHRIIFIAWIVVYAVPVFGQPFNDYRYVDSTTYKLYNTKKWQNLSELGKIASEAGLDYYFLNLRVGIAFYHLYTLYETEKFLKKSLHNNSKSDVAKEYLYWTYFNRGEELRANKIATTISDSVKKRMGIEKRKFADFIYFEGGNKFSDNADTSGDVAYINMGIRHSISPSIHLYETFTYMNQTNIWGSYVQYQFYIRPTFYIYNGWYFNIGFHYSDYFSKLNYTVETRKFSSRPMYDQNYGQVIADTNTIIKKSWRGEYHQRFYVASLGFTKSAGRWKLDLMATVMGDYDVPNYKQVNIQNSSVTIRRLPGMFIVDQKNISPAGDSTTFNMVMLRSFLEPGIGLSFVPGILKDRIEAGARLYVVINRGGNFKPIDVRYIPIPYINIRINKGISISASYFEKGNYPIADNYGATLINSYDNINKRTSATGSFLLSSKITLFVTYMNEDIIDILSLSKYSLNTLLVGLKFRI